MLRKAGNTILHVLMTPVRIVRRAIEWLVAVRSFTDIRRRDLAVLVVVAMMVLVAIKLRYSGYADAHAVEYVKNALPDTEAVAQSNSAVALAGDSDRDAADRSTANESVTVETTVTERPNVAVTVSSSRQVPEQQPVQERTLILPMPNVVSAPVAQPDAEPIVPVLPATQSTVPTTPRTKVVPALPTHDPVVPAEPASPEPIATARLTGEIETADSGVDDDMADDVPAPSAGSNR